MDADRKRRGTGGGADAARSETAREHRQEMLDEALEDTFPASDPPAVRPNRKDPDPVPKDPVQDEEEEEEEDGAG